MLNNLSAQIRNCYRQAEDCARKAAAQTDPRLKQDFLASERRWLLLARSYEFSSRLTDFSAWAERRPPLEVYYALHICLKDGHHQTEYNRRGELPRLGEFISVTLGDEQTKVRVVNVITAPSVHEPVEFAYYVYAVEI
jgi:hypothetical protein